MISPECHTREWILTHRDALAGADPLILEKAIFALTLLDALAATPLDFVFKGGTAILLHLPHPKRLSIDIDIVCPAPQAELDQVLTQILPSTPFTHWVESQRGERGLPGRRHYRFHYASPTQERVLHILLDVVTEENPLHYLERKTINTPFLKIEESNSAQLPTIDSLLADKLTAFAPNSVGVPLTQAFSQQVIKQLFDIGQLFEHAGDLEILRTENENSFKAEARYSNFQGSHHDYLDDLIDTAYRLSALDLRRAPNDQPAKDTLLRRGINQLSNHIIGMPFRLPEAKVAAARAACLASILKQDATSPTSLPRYSPEALAQAVEHGVGAKHACLNRLKSFAPEAYFYWATGFPGSPT